MPDENNPKTSPEKSSLKKVGQDFKRLDSKLAGLKTSETQNRDAGIQDSGQSQQLGAGKDQQGQKENQAQTAESPDSGQPQQQGAGKAGKDASKNPEKTGLAQRGKNYAKEKGKEFLDKTGALSRAQMAKQEFEERLLKFKEQAKSEPIKQRPGESDLAFRRRQQREDDENPDNVKDRSVGNVLKERLKDEGNRQIRKGTEYGKKQLGKATKGATDYASRKIASSPKLTKLANAAIEGKRKAEEAKAKSEEIKKRFAQKMEKLNAIKKLRNKLERQAKAKAAQVAQKAAEMTARIAAQVARAALQATVSALSAVIAALSEVIVVLLIIIIIFAAIDYVCNSGGLLGAACSVGGWLGSWLPI